MKKSRGHAARSAGAFYLESLGCSKNTVDSEIMASMLRERGFTPTDDPGKAGFVIVNTCAFIDEAKEESIDVILDLAGKKKEGARLIVTGCFPQLYYRELKKTMPEIDILLGTGDLRPIVDAVEKPAAEYPESRRFPETHIEYPVRNRITHPGYAYVKISDGCSRKCSFCAIPLIKGPMRSRRSEDIVREALHLEKMGVRELIFTSQDTFSYGEDLDQKGLKNLIRDVLDRTTIPSIRLLYLRPGRDVIDLLDLFNEEARLLPYFDIPVQHVSDRVLRLMNRSGSAGGYERLIGEIRERCPEAVLRTTVMVGFPGEGKDEFRELMEFVESTRFNHLGVFTFSPQEGTEAYRHMKKSNTATMHEAEIRSARLLELQRSISGELLQEYVGREYDVLIENEEDTGIKPSPGVYSGRSYHFAPDVDGLFYVETNLNPLPGEVLVARVTGSGEYDLFGTADEKARHGSLGGEPSTACPPPEPGPRTECQNR